MPYHWCIQNLSLLRKILTKYEWKKIRNEIRDESKLKIPNQKSLIVVIFQLSSLSFLLFLEFQIFCSLNKNVINASSIVGISVFIELYDNKTITTSGFWSQWTNSFRALHFCRFSPRMYDLYVDCVGVYFRKIQFTKVLIL